MSTGPHELGEEYSAAMREFCAMGGDAALSWAYQLGHQAVGADIGVLEMATIHQKALVKALIEMVDGDESTRIAHRASEFFAEALAPFEQRHRRYQEERSTLSGLNEGLEQWLHAAQHKLEAAQDQLLEQRRAEQRNNEFICAMSHETHGSLTVLKSGLGGELNAQSQGLLDMALRSSERVMRLVGESPDVHSTESGAMAFNGIRTAARSGSGSS